MNSTERVQQLKNITTAQRDFLNKFIHQEGASSVKSKIKQAEDFNRRRGKVLIALSKVPNVNGLQNAVRNLLDMADKSAENGNFKEAYEKLEEVKKEAKKLVANFDPTELIESIKSKANEIFSLHELAGDERLSFAYWLKYYREAADRNEENSLDEDVEPLEELARQFEQEWISEYSRWLDWKNFSNRASDLNELLQSIPEIHRVSLMNGVESKLGPVYEKLIRVNSSFETMKSALPELEYEVDLLRIRLTSNMSETEREIHRDEHAIEGTPSPTEGVFKDVVKFPLSSFLQEEDFKSLDYVSLNVLSTQAEHVLTRWIQKQNFGPDSDETLNLIMMTKNKFLNELESNYIKTHKLEREQKLDRAVTDRLNVIADGFFKAAISQSPNSIDVQAGTVMVGGITYGSKEFLGSGGLGAVYRFTDNKGNTVVVKEATGAKAEKNRILMENEILVNHQILKGDDHAIGRKNITKMKGAVQSTNGNLYMIMEEAAGGDMKKLKSVMMALTQTSSLPEGTKSIINQYLLKGSIQGLQYLRDQNMVHFDLKEENIFLGEDGTPQISDFGSVRSSQTGDVAGRFDGVTVGYDDPNNKTQADADVSLKFLMSVLEGNDFKPFLLFGILGIKDMTQQKYNRLEAEKKTEYLNSIRPLITQKIKELELAGCSYGFIWCMNADSKFAC